MNARAVRDRWLALERDWLALFERKLRRKARGHAVVTFGDMRSALDRVHKILEPSADHDCAIRPIQPSRFFGDRIDPVLCMTSVPCAIACACPMACDSCSPRSACDCPSTRSSGRSCHVRPEMDYAESKRGFAVSPDRGRLRPAVDGLVDSLSGSEKWNG